MTRSVDGPKAAPGNIGDDGKITTADVGGMPGFPVGRGTVWVTLEQADQAAPHGWARVPQSETDDGLVLVTR